MHRLFTSESVTEGHPDKVADSISDSVLDALFTEDPKSRVAVETLVTTGLVVVAGEVTTDAYAEIGKIARQRVLDIGYTSSDIGFDGESCGVMVALGSQSPDIAQGVNSAEERRAEGSGDDLDSQGAGDQGLMFGYACSDTATLMPLPIDIAHRLAEKLAAARRQGVLDYLRPDGKTQVTIAYDGDVPVAIDTVVVSTQHRADVSQATIRADLEREVIEPVLATYDLARPDLKVYVNPTGSFVVGGPMGDAGVTGRKIIVDTLRRHGPPRWRCLLGQGPVQGRPFRRVRDALGRQERRRLGSRDPLRGAGRVRDRPGAPGRPVRGLLRHREGRRSSRSRRLSSRSSTCARRRSSATSTCSARSTR